MKEWTDKFNSFNSYKGLLYSKWYEAVNKERFLPPIEASLDPIQSCNLMCRHCNAHRYLNKPKRMTDEHLISLVDYLGNWGVKAVCFGGGGEPTLHTKLADAIYKCRRWGMEVSVATNGTLFTPGLLNALTNCRWVGVSIDAATPKTYKIGRNKDLFYQATHNLELLVRMVRKTNSFCDVSFKFLIFDYNQHEIFDACKLAKSLGVKDFHARPADFRHQGMGTFKKTQSGYDIDLIKEQFEKCHKLATKDFRVFTISHKFNDDFTPKRNFTGCYAAPICIQLCADGGIYFCPDTRHIPFYKLGTHYPDISNIKSIWGEQRHRDLVYKLGCENCKSRCTFSAYNEQAERLFINTNDPMCWRFV